MGRALSEQRAISVADVKSSSITSETEAHRLGRIRSALAVPLMHEGEPVGIIGVVRYMPDPSTDRQIQLVKTFADQAVIAIENSRLFEEVQARTRELSGSLERQKATTEVLNVISRAPTELQAVFDRIVRIAPRLCEADYAIIFRYKDDSNYHLVAANDAAADYVRFRMENPISADRSTAIGSAVLDQRVVHWPDYPDDPAHPQARIGRIRTPLAVPLIEGNVVTGVIGIARTVRDPFNAFSSSRTRRIYAQSCAISFRPAATP